jgi:RNA methyltransferase, TrmH family
LNLGNRSDEAPLTARRRREYRSLARAKGRRELGQYLIEGLRAVESAIMGEADLVDVVVGTSVAEDRAILDLVRGISCPLLSGTPQDLIHISDAVSSQGIVAAARIPAPGTLGLSPCVVLDGLQDPGNVGTLIRTAAWYGVRSVVCGPGTADPYQPKAVRSSQGGLWDLDVHVLDDLDPVFRLARAKATPVYVADLGGTDASEWKPDWDSVLIIGSEARGPSDAVLAEATESVSLPRYGTKTGTESLNAAVAGGILMDRWLARTTHPSG